MSLRVEGTPDNNDRSRMLIGWQDGQTAKYGAALQPLYSDNNEDWQFVISAIDPENQTSGNNLRIRKEFVSADKAFRMTAYDQNGVDGLPQTPGRYCCVEY